MNFKANANISMQNYFMG